VTIIITILTILVTIAILIFFNALYVAGEFATVGARKARIIQMAQEGSRLAKMLQPVIEDPQKLDSTIAASQVGITLSSIILGIFGQNQIAPLISPILGQLPFVTELTAAGISATVVLLLLTTLQVLLGELIPKSVALQYPEQIALATIIPLKVSAEILLKPLIVILNGSGRLVLSLFGLHTSDDHAHIHSPEEIIILVKESHKSGLIDAEERQLLRNVFRAAEVTAAEIAKPRNYIVAVNVEHSLEEILKLAADSAYTRIPVFENDIDHIIGFVHLREVFNLYNETPEGDVRTILREVPFVPETLTAMQVWQRLNEEQSYIAIVFDEYGGTSGLITREDLVEELFGELQDEFDQERDMITPVGDGRIVVRGDMAVTQLNDLYELDLPTENVHSVGGYIIEQLKRIPGVGDTVVGERATLRVESVANNAINSVSVMLSNKDEDSREEELEA